MRGQKTPEVIFEIIIVLLLIFFFCVGNCLAHHTQNQEFRVPSLDLNVITPEKPKNMEYGNIPPFQKPGLLPSLITQKKGNTSIHNEEITDIELSGSQTFMELMPDQMTEIIEKQREIERNSSEYQGPPLPLASLSLQSYLPYFGKTRDQGTCGNCWVWACTGAVEIEHTIETGIKKRLSIQHFNSNFYNTGKNACTGGSVPDYTGYISSKLKKVIPWANTNAGGKPTYFSDIKWVSGPPLTPASSISEIPNYPISSINYNDVPTYGVSQTSAINSIKANLRNKKPVVYLFHLGESGMNAFHYFWDNETTSSVWDPDPYMNEPSSKAHFVLIIGYNDTVPIPYWIVLNSWGTTEDRQSGLFRLKMNMNYKGRISYKGIPLYSHMFWTVDTTFSQPPTINSITPSSAPNTNSVTITNLSGNNFTKGMNVSLTRTGYSAIIAKNVTVISPTKITCNFPLTGKTEGVWNVEVMNNEGMSGILENGFAITDYRENYQFFRKWGSKGNKSGQFISPSGIAVDSKGNVYVADSGNHRIQKFNSNGRFLTKWGSFGTKKGKFNGPSGIAVDSKGNVYVVDWGNNRIQKFNSNGMFLAKWGSYGKKSGQFNGPSGIAVDSKGYVYVGDIGNHRIQKFNSNGMFLAKWGSYGTRNGQFISPSGIAVDSKDNVYVADLSLSRIQKFSSNGKFLFKWGSRGTENGQFQYPIGVGIDSLGNVYVTDTTYSRVQKFSPKGTFLAVWGGSGSGNGAFLGPYGIAVNRTGTVFISDYGNNRIQVFRKS